MSQISHNILQRVTHFIEQQQLFLAPASPVLVGLSGGADSVTLLHILHTLGFECQALHCNFQLRGEESDRDEMFCRQLCQWLDVPIQVKHFDTRRHMREHHLSLEMSARQLRYEWWASMTDAQTRIALGHHQDDSIETLLINLMRGTGIQGMTGIVAHNEQTHVVRPLLCLSRHDILDYLSDNGLSYVIDSTNAENDTLRNQIRNQLLPLMEQMVPQVRAGIAQTIGHLQGSATFANRLLDEYDHLTEHHNQCGLQWDELQIERLQAHFTDRECSDYLFEWQRRHCNPATQRTIRTDSLIYTCPADAREFDTHRPAMVWRIQNITPGASFQKNAPGEYSAMFDADSVTLPLILRRWREGDRIAPLGMNGHTKLVSDLFTNAHYTPMQKATTWLLTDSTGAILWVAGLRISELHKITPSTSRVIKVLMSTEVVALRAMNEPRS